MERDSDVCDLIAPSPNRDPAPPAHRDFAPVARRGTEPPDSHPIPPVPRPVHPLPAGYRLPFLAPFCYSPRGMSPRAEKSRTLRDLVKRADPATLARCVARLPTLIDPGAARDFLGPDVVLVPVPRRVPYDPRDRPSAPEAIARALHAVGLGKVVWPGAAPHPGDTEIRLVRARLAP